MFNQDQYHFAHSRRVTRAHYESRTLVHPGRRCRHSEALSWLSIVCFWPCRKSRFFSGSALVFISGGVSYALGNVEQLECKICSDHILTSMWVILLWETASVPNSPCMTCFCVSTSSAYFAWSELVVLSNVDADVGTVRGTGIVLCSWHYFHSSNFSDEKSKWEKAFQFEEFGLKIIEL